MARKNNLQKYRQLHQLKIEREKEQEAKRQQKQIKKGDKPVVLKAKNRKRKGLQKIALKKVSPGQNASGDTAMKDILAGSRTASNQDPKVDIRKADVMET